MLSTRVSTEVKGLFTDAFTARDVAEPLASFDADADAAAVREFMAARDFDIVGVRVDGQVAGYVTRGSLEGGACREHQRPLEAATILRDADPLLAVLTGLKDASFLFVNTLGAVGGIVTRADMQKPPVRMWLFGIVTLVEMRFAELLEDHCPGDSWKQYLSEGRLQKAQALLDERSRRNQQLRLVDCLQFSDKGQIIARNEDVRKLTVFASRRQAEDATKQLEQLRNNLAHAQDILTSDWDTIIRLCEFIAHR
jgi:hypothetical protein